MHYDVLLSDVQTNKIQPLFPALLPSVVQQSSKLFIHKNLYVINPYDSTDNEKYHISGQLKQHVSLRLSGKKQFLAF